MYIDGAANFVPIIPMRAAQKESLHRAGSGQALFVISLKPLYIIVKTLDIPCPLRRLDPAEHEMRRRAELIDAKGSDSLTALLCVDAGDAGRCRDKSMPERHRGDSDEVTY